MAVVLLGQVVEEEELGGEGWACLEPI